MEATIQLQTRQVKTYTLPYYFKRNGDHFAWIAPNESICVGFRSLRISKNDTYCEASIELELYADKCIEITQDDFEWAYSEWDRFQRGYVQEKALTKTTTDDAGE